MLSSLRRFFPLAIAITGLCFIQYVALQQYIRAEANDPQIEVAENIRNSLVSGEANMPGIVAAFPRVSIEQSLSLFVLFYDAKGKTLMGSGFLGGINPTPPLGVLESALKSGENRVTWQPESGVRIASVVLPVIDSQNNLLGYVLAGRSLREVEKRESQLEAEVALLWLLILVATYLFVFVFSGPRFHSTP